MWAKGANRVGDNLRQALTTLLPRLRRFGLALTGSANDADELVQNVCERVLLRSGQLRDETRMDAWLYGIMRNLWIDELRHRRVRRHEDIDAASGVMGDDGQAVAEGRITLAMVRRTMGELPDDQRTVLMLVCVDGLSYKEAAEVLGIPVGTVMSRLSRARQDLHQRMAGRATGDTVTKLPVRAERNATGQDRVRPL